jgi:hypothetical protein
MIQMTMKKMLLLASMALAAIAFAAPAAAQANLQWYVESPEEVLEGEAEFSATGVITNEALGGVFSTGPAAVDFSGVLYNEEGKGHGTITQGTITGTNIPTNLGPTCVVTAATIASGIDWTITTSTTDPEITIDNATFLNHYSSGCAAFGVPSTVSAQGDVTGTVKNGVNKACIVLNKSGDMKNEVTAGTVTLTGEVCIPGFTLK